MNYLVRYVGRDGAVMRRTVSALDPCILVDAALARHLEFKYPCAREDTAHVEHIRRYGVGPMRTVTAVAREHHLVGGRLVAWDHVHRAAYGPGLAPDSWPLGDSGWPTMPPPVDMTATVLGARAIVEIVDPGDFGRRWVDAVVTGTPEALLLKGGASIPMSTKAARLIGDLPGGAFELGANGQAWKRRDGLVVETLSRIADAVVTLGDIDFGGAGPGRVIVERDGKWSLLGDLA